MLFLFGLENLFKLYFFLKNNSDKNIFFTDPGWFLIAKRYLKIQKISFDYKNKDLIQANLYFFFNKFWKIYNIYNCLRYMNNLCIPTNKVIKKKFANIDIIFFSIWQNDTINKYYNTLFNLCVKHDNLELISNELKFIKHLIRKESSFRLLFDSKKLTDENKCLI